MNVKDLFVFFAMMIYLTNFSMATNKQCHNQTGRCFWLGNGSKAWDAARTACQSDGGHLAVMENEELHNFASNLFKAR